MCAWTGEHGTATLPHNAGWFALFYCLLDWIVWGQQTLRLPHFGFASSSRMVPGFRHILLVAQKRLHSHRMLRPIYGYLWLCKRRQMWSLAYLANFGRRILRIGKPDTDSDWLAADLLGCHLILSEMVCYGCQCEWALNQISWVQSYVFCPSKEVWPKESLLSSLWSYNICDVSPPLLARIATM